MGRSKDRRRPREVIPPLSLVAAGVLAFTEREPADPAAEQIHELAAGAQVPPGVIPRLFQTSAPAPRPQPVAERGDRPRYWWQRD